MKKGALAIGNTCRRGHPITGPESIVIHGKDLRLRCRVCVMEARARWKARGYQPKEVPA